MLPVRENVPAAQARDGALSWRQRDAGLLADWINIHVEISLAGLHEAASLTEQSANCSWQRTPLDLGPELGLFMSKCYPVCLKADRLNI